MGWSQVATGGASTTRILGYVVVGGVLYYVYNSSTPRSFTGSAFANLTALSGTINAVSSISYTDASQLIVTGQGFSNNHAAVWYSTLPVSAWTKQETNFIGGVRGIVNHTYGSYSFLVAGSDGTNFSLRGKNGVGGAFEHIENIASAASNYIERDCSICEPTSSFVFAAAPRKTGANQITHKGYNNGAQLYAATGVNVSFAATYIENAVAWSSQSLGMALTGDNSANSHIIGVNSSGTSTVSQALTGIFRMGCVSTISGGEKFYIVKSDGTPWSRGNSGSFADSSFGAPSLGGATAIGIFSLDGSDLFVLASDGTAYEYTSVSSNTSGLLMGSSL